MPPYEYDKAITVRFRLWSKMSAVATAQPRPLPVLGTMIAHVASTEAAPTCGRKSRLSKGLCAQ